MANISTGLEYTFGKMEIPSGHKEKEYSLKNSVVFAHKVKEDISIEDWAQKEFTRTCSISSGEIAYKLIEERGYDKCKAIHEARNIMCSLIPPPTEFEVEKSKHYELKCDVYRWMVKDMTIDKIWVDMKLPTAHGRYKKSILPRPDFFIEMILIEDQNSATFRTWVECQTGMSRDLSKKMENAGNWRDTYDLYVMVVENITSYEEIRFEEFMKGLDKKFVLINWSTL